jgi:hypothetical protein
LQSSRYRDENVTKPGLAQHQTLASASRIAGNAHSHTILVVILGVVFCIACAVPTIPGSPTASPGIGAPPLVLSQDAATDGTAVASTVSVELLFLSVDPDPRQLRFVAKLTHPGSHTIEGLQLRWDATDASGASVGSATVTQPPLPAGRPFLFVGDTGGVRLAGVPRTVRFTVTDLGRASAAPAPGFAVGESRITRESLRSAKVGDDYTVAADVTTGWAPVSRAAIVTSAILRDASGLIVGAATGAPWRLPDPVPPGTKFRAAVRVSGVTDEPATGEVVAYARPDTRRR